ncbi:hypothetical protein QBC34DRAFT_151653 [Podospora aff. communis PSN243]|uniref:Uncharacterized protein n=1 Tax=Podospora aff. communis PSN243 TaxID=3040156 RepID=A0AAV9GDD9_9PEZI|nr:hypothetical protein QBC34DRAFT_151653 [Podospora aff. communis PSN243]
MASITRRPKVQKTQTPHGRNNGRRRGRELASSSRFVTNLNSRQLEDERDQIFDLPLIAPNVQSIDTRKPELSNDTHDKCFMYGSPNPAQHRWPQSRDQQHLCPRWIQIEPLDQPHDQKERTFACLHYKRDADTHKGCRGLVLSRIKDVWQHIRRKHIVPLDCPHRHDRFAMLQFIEEHERSTAPCRREGIVCRRHLDVFLMMTRENDPTRAKPAAVQWRELWDFLFPGVETPASVYVETREEEMASHIYSVWARNPHEIAAQVNQESLLTQRDRMEIPVQVFDLFLQHLLKQLKHEGAYGRQKSPASVTSESTHHRSEFSDLDSLFLTDDCTSTSSNSAIGEGTPPMGNQCALFPSIDIYSTSNDASDRMEQETLPLYRTMVWPDCPPVELPWLDPPLSVDGQGFSYGDDLPTTQQAKFARDC